MTRLIDAEHLINKAEQENKDGLLEDDGLETIYYELSDEPTVDAIPIEWIQRYYAYHPFTFVSGMLYDWAMEQAERKEE